MKKYLFISVMIAILNFLSSIAFAHEDGRGPHQCGPGSQISESSTFRVLSNLTSFPTYFAATSSGSSHCKSLVQSNMTKELYVQYAYDKLSEEISQGKGLHLEALTILLGCPPENHNQVVQITREHYQDLFPTLPNSLQENRLQPQKFLETLQFYIIQTPSLSQRCLNVEPLHS